MSLLNNALQLPFEPFSRTRQHQNDLARSHEADCLCLPFLVAYVAACGPDRRQSLTWPADRHEWCGAAFRVRSRLQSGLERDSGVVTEGGLSPTAVTTPAWRPFRGRLAVVVDRTKHLILQANEGSALARPAHQRSSDEAVHAFSPHRHARRRRREGRVFHRHRLPHRSRPEVAVAEEATTRPPDRKSTRLN